MGFCALKQCSARHICAFNVFLVPYLPALIDFLKSLRDRLVFILDLNSDSCFLPSIYRACSRIMFCKSGKMKSEPSLKSLPE